MTTVKKKNKEIGRYKEGNERVVKYGLDKTEYQGHIVWCDAEGGIGNNKEKACYGVNFFSIKSHDTTTWISRILNAPTLKYNCRWCGEQNHFDSIMFMNGELTLSFYADFRAGKIDKCVSYVSKFLHSLGYRVTKESLKVIMQELFIHAEKRK
tara:strand:+ start:214 stop:672 length:459 start_codon:yes stop_codon:yes gene_type:complete